MDVKFVVMYLQCNNNNYYGDYVLHESEGLEHYPSEAEIAELGDIGILWDYANVEKRYYPKSTETARL